MKIAHTFFLTHRFKESDEVRAWLRKSIRKRYRTEWRPFLGFTVMIERDEDAVLFMLAWAHKIRRHASKM